MLTKKLKIIAFSLVLLTFVMGTSEFVIVGLLTEIAVDLNESVAKIGSLVSGFAIAYAVATPFITGYVSKFPKYPLMLILILIFIVGNVISALTPTYVVLLISRIITAAVSGVLTALAMTIASDTMPPEKRSSVISLIFSGFTIANVLGVPLGTFIGQLSSWHYTFWITAFLGLLAFIICWYSLPKVPVQEQGSILEYLVILKNPKIILAFFIPAFGFAACYTVYTYITPIIEEELNYSSSSVSTILLVYGFFSILSNIISGKIAEKNGISKLRFAFIAEAIVLVLLYFTMDMKIVGLINIMIMGAMIYMMNATSQLFLMDEGAKYSKGARDFAASLTPVAANVGITLGSLLGALVVMNGSMRNLALIGAACSLIASLLSFIVLNKQKEKSLVKQ